MEIKRTRLPKLNPVYTALTVDGVNNRPNRFNPDDHKNIIIIIYSLFGVVILLSIFSTIVVRYVRLAIV